MESIESNTRQLCLNWKSQAAIEAGYPGLTVANTANCEQTTETSARAVNANGFFYYVVYGVLLMCSLGPDWALERKVNQMI